MLTPNYRSFVKVVEFFQTRYIRTYLHSTLNGFVLEFTYQCNDGKRTVFFHSYSEHTLLVYSYILSGNTSHFDNLCKESKIRFYNSLCLFPHHAAHVVVLGTGIK